MKRRVRLCQTGNLNEKDMASPKATAFTAQDCDGTAVDGGTIPLNNGDGPCQEIVVGAGSASASTGGQSGIHDLHV